MTNNHAGFALWKGFEMATGKKISSLCIFGDSMSVIRQMTKAKKKIFLDSNPLNHRVLVSTSQFEKLEFFQILEFELNS